MFIHVIVHAKMFSIQILLHFSQIVQRVCTLALFIFIVVHVVKRQSVIKLHNYSIICKRQESLRMKLGSQGDNNRPVNVKGWNLAVCNEQ